MITTTESINRINMIMEKFREEQDAPQGFESKFPVALGMGDSFFTKAQGVCSTVPKYQRPGTRARLMNSNEMSLSVRQFTISHIQSTENKSTVDAFSVPILFNHATGNIDARQNGGSLKEVYIQDNPEHAISFADTGRYDGFLSPANFGIAIELPVTVKFKGSEYVLGEIKKYIAAGTFPIVRYVHED